VKTYPDVASSDGTSSAVVAGDKVLVGHSTFAEVSGDTRSKARGGVEAFSTKDGSRLWTYWTADGDETGAMVWSTVSVDLKEQVVYASTGNNYTVVGGGSDAIHAIDLENGERKWRKQVREGDIWTIFGSNAADPLADTDFGANPILAQVDGMPVVAAGDKGSAFWALRRDTGEVLWSRQDLSNKHTPSNGGVLMNGAFDGKNFYVVANEPPDHALLHVLSARDGSDVREPLRLDAITWGAPSLANGLLFVPVGSVLHVYNAKTGDELTSFETGGTIAAGAAAIADGYVIVKSGLQYMYAADAKNNNEVIAYGLGKPPVKAMDMTDEDAGVLDPNSFTAIYKDIFVGMGCSGAALCHGGDGGKLTMKDQASTYKALFNVKAMGTNSVPGQGKNCADSGLTRVVPNKPDESLLLQKLEGKQTCGAEMPPSSKLKDAQIARVRAWIEAGAKDN
jgi:outer membrane protein assembly factor BamB